MPAIEVELPDGSVAEFPEDMPQDKISEAIKTHLSPRPTPVNPQLGSPGADVPPTTTVPASPELGRQIANVAQGMAPPPRSLAEADAIVGNKAVDALNYLRRLGGNTNKIAPLQPGQGFIPESVLEPGREKVAQALDAITKSGKSEPGVDRETTPNTPAAEGLSKVAKGFVAGSATPSGLLMLPALETKLGQGAFAIIQALETPGQVKNAIKVYNDPKSTAADKWEATGNVGLNIAMTAGLALHLAPDVIKARFTPEEAAKIAQPKPVPPEIQQANAAGLKLAATEAAKSVPETPAPTSQTSTLVGTDILVPQQLTTSSQVHWRPAKLGSITEQQSRTGKKMLVFNWDDGRSDGVQIEHEGEPNMSEQDAFEIALKRRGAKKASVKGGEENAEGIRENQGQPQAAGKAVEGGKTDSGSDVQQTPSEQPQPVGARGGTPQSEVALKPPEIEGTRFLGESKSPSLKQGRWSFEADFGNDVRPSFSVRAGASEAEIREALASKRREYEPTLTADQALAKPSGSVAPEHIENMDDDELLKLTSAKDENGERKFKVQVEGILWGDKQRAEALPAIESKAKSLQKEMLAAMQDPKRASEAHALQQRAQFFQSAAEGIRGRNDLPGVRATYDYLVDQGKIKPKEVTPNAKEEEEKEGGEVLASAAGGEPSAAVSYDNDKSYSSLKKSGVVSELDDQAKDGGDLITVEGKPAGWMKVDDDGILQAIEIKPEFRRKGVASKVVNDLAKAQGTNKLKVFLPTEQGRALFESLGKLEVNELGEGTLILGEAEPEKVTNKGAETLAKPATSVPIGAGPGAATAKGATVEGTGEVPVEEGGEAVPMGAAGAGEVPATGQQPGGTHGVSHEVLEQRRLRGEVAPVERGQGIGAEASVERGRQLLQGGADAEAALSNFEKTGRFSADDLAVARAHGERLAKASKDADAQFGPNSPEAEAAWEADSAWTQRLKKMSTEWHKAGMAQQGETEIDTGTFHGLRKAHQEITGDDFTPKQRKKAQEVAGTVKNAQDAVDATQQQVKSAIRQASGNIDAEKRALDAAHKTVRENAIRLAELEKKTAIARTVEEMKAAKIAEEQARKSLKQAQDQARDAAAKMAKAQREAEVPDVKQQQRDADAKAAKDALDAANETVRKNAIRLAEAEKKAQLAQGARDKAFAEKERKAAQKAVNEGIKMARDAAVRSAKAEQANLANPERQVWQKVSDYLDKGVDDFNDIRSKVATDLGISVDKVTKLMGQKPRVKYLMNELWKKQNDLRRVKEQARRWLTDTSIPGYQRALAASPRALEKLKVGFHGTVALGTHAPTVAFQPRFWKSYVTDFGRMYRMVGSPAYYEQQMQGLVRRPNFTTAARAGLVNDPFTYEEYMSPTVANWSNKLFDKFPASKKGLDLYNIVMASGNRGYGVLKILRQDMFDQMWNQLPKTAQINEVASAIADGINHATGVVKGKAPKGSNVALFAPRLNASRAAWLVVDPIKSAATFLDWKNASEGDKQFAINQLKEKAWVVGTLGTLLALNQGILSATGSKQKINFTDPMKGDFLKFKAAGMDLSYGNPMITMARLPARLYAIRSSDGGKLRNLVYPDEDTYSVLGEYARSQASPFASLTADLWLKSDWMRRQMPNSDRPMPKRLTAQGVKRYTWPEFLSEQALPIPAEEAAREVWKTGMGMTPDQIKEARKALATISVMAATGARLTDDWDTKSDVTKDIANWKKQKGYENPPPVVPARANDDLMASLKADNATDARKALDQMVEGKSPAEVRKIAEHYRKTLHEDQYLTGSRKHEQEYVKTLDASGKQAYDEAKAERKAMWQKFVKAWRSKYPAPTQ